MNTQEILEIIKKAAKGGGLSRFSDMKSLMHFICQNFDLTPEFIREYKDVVNWKSISAEQQIIDTNFLREFQDKLDWNYVGQRGRFVITEEQKRQFREHYNE